MAVNVTVYDLDTYPDNSKTVTTDQKALVPVGYEGDEQWIMSFTTTAYSDNTERTAIQDIYVREMKAGWLKSSGFTGTGGKFTLVSGISNQLKVKIDASAGEAGGVGYYAIELTPGVNLSGDAIAADMQVQIRALPDDSDWIAADAGYALSYRNAMVDFTDGRFKIISGNVGKYYTGTQRSSVAIAKYPADACYEGLGFDLVVDSQTIAGISAKEALLASSYLAGAATVVIGTGTSVAAGDCMMITDGVTTDYFQVITVSGTTLTVPTVAVNNFDGIANSYDADVSKVQVLREQDPEQVPTAYHTTIDSITRWGIMSITNQIDFSS